MTEQDPPFKWRGSLFLYLAVSFTAFFPCLILGKSYFANDLLYGYGPIRSFLKQQLAAGNFPLWNQYLWGGQPFFAEPNTMMVYPLNYLTLVFSIPYGYSVFFFLHMFLAAWGTHFFLRSLRLSEGPCRIASLAYALSGFFWWELIHLPILAAFAWFPWFLGALERLHKGPKPLNAFWAGLAYALVFISGNFQIALGIFYTGLLYLGLRMAERHGLKDLFSLPFRSRDAFKKTLLVGLFTLWGGFPLFFHLIPAAELSKHSNRQADNTPYEKFAGTFSMRPSTLYEFLFPTLGLAQEDTIENAIQQITDNVNIDNRFLANFGYLGVWVPFLMIIAFQRKERAVLWGLAGLALLSVLTALGRYFPLHELFCSLLPGFKMVRAPFRFLDTYVLAACALAAFGLQNLENGGDRKLSSRRGFIGLIYALVLLVVSLSRPGETWREILALLLGLSGLSLWCWTESWKKMGRLLFQTAVILPLLLTGWSGFSLGPPSNFNYKEKFPVTSLLGTTHPQSRFFLDSSQPGYPIEAGGKTFQMYIPENLPEVLGFRTTSGYNPVFLKKTSELKQVSQDAYFQLMGVRGFLQGRDVGDQKGYTRQILDNLFLYSLEKPPAYVTAPHQSSVITGDAERLEAMKNPGFKPAETALLSEALPSSIVSQLSGQKAQVKAEMIQDQSDHQIFKVALDKNSLVVFSEVMFPGWSALLDGKPAQLLTSNHVFRTVFVPAGEHQVEFLFEPSWFKPIAAAACLWLLSVIFYGAYLLKRKKITTTQ